MKLKINETDNLMEDDCLMEMANVLGKKVKIPHKLPFSFYFSTKNNVVHNIRVKPVFNPEKLSVNMTGTLKLCDNWEYIPGKDDYNVSNRDVAEMKAFFREYLVLFCLVWEEKLNEDDVQDYLRAFITFNELLQQIEFYTEDMDYITTIKELENYCRENDLVNFYGN